MIFIVFSVSLLLLLSSFIYGRELFEVLVLNKFIPLFACVITFYRSDLQLFNYNPRIQ